MIKYIANYVLLLLALSTSCAQNHPEAKKTIPPSKTKAVTTSHGPTAITRNIIQDSQGIIWIAAFDGIFRYDGTSFAHMTRQMSSARFFSVLEDSNGHLWFGTIGSGVYHYDGESFTNFTTGDGLLNNRVDKL